MLIHSFFLLEPVARQALLAAVTLLCGRLFWACPRCAWSGW